jgi:predicted TIM-barrel fold metal-dependent hydrolase
VACKISGIVASAKRGAWSADTLAPFVEHCRGAFGPDRLVFGTDWPVCTLVASPREWVEALQQIVAGWSLADRRKLLRDNAVRIYRL